VSYAQDHENEKREADRAAEEAKAKVVGPKSKPMGRIVLPGDLRYEEVDHPPHYEAGGIEAIDVIEAWKLDFSLGCSLKYIARAGKKPGVPASEDLKKAIWYLNRALINAQEEE